VTSDGHGGTLITDPPVTTGGSVTGNSSVDTVPSSAGFVIFGGYELGEGGCE
jgi:hypothetical protein